MLKYKFPEIGGMCYSTNFYSQGNYRSQMILILSASIRIPRLRWPRKVRVKVAKVKSQIILENEKDYSFRKSTVFSEYLPYADVKKGFWINPEQTDSLIKDFEREIDKAIISGAPDINEVEEYEFSENDAAMTRKEAWDRIWREEAI